MRATKAKRIDMLNRYAPHSGLITGTGSITITGEGEFHSSWTWERHPKSDSRLDFESTSRAVCAGRE